jgi:hypothetical protein
MAVAWCAACASTGAGGTSASPDGETCESVPAGVGDDKIDLAPPGGYMETCWVDSRLCTEPVPGRPEGHKMLGFFLTSGDWARHRRRQELDLGTYLIAQSTATPAAEFPDLREILRQRGQDAVDISALPASFQPQTMVSVGVVDESADSISSGVLFGSAFSRRRSAAAPEVSINTAFMLGSRVLSLHVNHAYSGRSDVDAARQLTAAWLECLRKANPAAGPSP